MLTQTDSYFRFQLELIMKELDLIDRTVSRLDEIILRNRNWGTTLWAGLVAILLRQDGFNPSMLLATAAIPTLFWLVDIRWKMALLQTGSRQKKISEFLNHDLEEAFNAGAIRTIDLLDPIGDNLPSEKQPRFTQALRYKDTFFFYPVQILGSLTLYLMQ